ncbi:MAG TPA: hypothetical protein PLT63_03610 [Syntrophales bacterium]|nr:hypothetical protein [Syntrophales bacterium]
MKAILDIKSGHVEPWTSLQLAAYTLLDAPVEFESDGHRYGNGLESVTQILKAEQLIDTRFYDDWSRDRGSMIHLATHYDDMGELDEETLDPVIRPYLEAWRKFRKESGFVPEVIEVPMMSINYRYAGTPDRIGQLPGKIKRAAVELHDDGGYRLIPYTDRQDVHIWLSVLAVHNWKRNNLKGR